MGLPVGEQVRRRRVDYSAPTMACLNKSAARNHEAAVLNDRALARWQSQSVTGAVRLSGAQAVGPHQEVRPVV